MTTQEVAEKLVAMNRDDLHMEIYEALYTDDVLSIENWGDRMEDLPVETDVGAVAAGYVSMTWLSRLEGVDHPLGLEAEAHYSSLLD